MTVSRTAKPCTPVQFRAWPLLESHICSIAKTWTVPPAEQLRLRVEGRIVKSPLPRDDVSEPADAPAGTPIQLFLQGAASASHVHAFGAPGGAPQLNFRLFVPDQLAHSAPNLPLTSDSHLLCA
jgi:hypothetical protein